MLVLPNLQVGAGWEDGARRQQKWRLGEHEATTGLSGDLHHRVASLVHPGVQAVFEIQRSTAFVSDPREARLLYVQK